MFDSTSEIEENSKCIMCIIFKCGRIAASYYTINEQMLYTTNEILDPPPDFLSTKLLLQTVKPSHLITFGSMYDNFIKALINIYENGDDTNSTLTNDQPTKFPQNFNLLPFKEFSYNKCEYRVKSLHLASEADNLSEEEHNLYLNSLINLQSKLLVHSLGALLKFLERNWCHLTDNENPISFHHIFQTTLKDNVYMDQIAFSSLQIFQALSHDSGFKHGRASCGREGMSLFKLFSNNCQSKIGYLKLRQMMMNPTKNYEDLNKRLDFLQYVLQPTKTELIDNLKEIIKQMSDVNGILGRIQYTKGTSADWESLYKTMYNILLFNEYVTPYVKECKIFAMVTETVSEDLYRLAGCINNSMEFKKGVRRSRPFIKEGLDEELDRDKMIQEDISKEVNAAAKIIVQQLPAYINECTLIYVPNMGHVVAIAKWAEDCDKHDLEDFGYKFMFEFNDSFHYKNPICQELDHQFGDIESKIIVHENRIIERVADFIIKHNNKIRQPLHVIASIDGLLAMATTAADKSYVRPKLNQENIINITEGRHPIVELTNSNYVTNNFISAHSDTMVKVITGPNSSGKSIYLKQVALLVYLAHIGCFVPATAANITLVDSIHTRLHATESASLNLSAFMIDLTQMARALNNAKGSSLIIMDEFGRGTSGTEGLALLMGALNTFLKRKESCPHILVTSHLLLNPKTFNNQLMEYKKMDYIRDAETDQIVFLYKLINGASNSYALDVANLIGLDEDILRRAKEFVTNLKNVKQLKTVQKHVQSKKYFKSVEIPDLDD